MVGEKEVNGSVCTLFMTKNGLPRKVPLSARARDLIARPVTLKPATLDATFRKVRDRAKITGLTFHDSRHEAITRLAERLDPLELARMVGHTDLKMLLTYYNKSAADIAARLDQPD